MSQRNRHLFTGIILLSVLFPVIVVGESSHPELEEEIDHLLHFIEHSGCTFIRNSTSYDGVRAREHIQRKYSYILKRKKELSAEQFIRYAASRSSLSGKPYMVSCSSKTRTSESWLLEELERYRQTAVNHSSGSGTP